MDNYTLIVELVKALAWPVTALIIFLALRKPLVGIIPYLQRVKIKDVELDWSRQVREVAEELERALPVSAPLSEAGREFHQRLARLAPQSPRAVILEAWLQLEDAAIAAAKKAGLQLSSQELRTPQLLGKALEGAGILTGEKLDVYNELRNLRNAAAHASELVVEPDTALEYADAAIRLAEYLLSYT